MNREEIIRRDILLKEEWAKSYGERDIDFIYDGATDVSQWIASPWRIMCLLKEAHGGSDWNHAEEIRRCGGLLRVKGTANPATHYRVVEWLYAIEGTLEGKDPDIEEDRSRNYPQARQTMLRSAWVNLKKYEGVAYSNDNNLSQVAKRDASFLLRQIEMLNPRIILCGRTFNIVKHELFPTCQPVPETNFTYLAANRIILNCNHPARKRRDSYKLLIEEIKRAQKSGLFREWARA